MIRLVSRISIILNAAMLATAGFAAGEPNDGIDVRIDSEDRMTITLNVAGEDVPAVLDTAATFFMIDRKVLDEANSRPLDSPVEVLGMDGFREYPSTRIGPLMTGATDLGTVEAAVNSRVGFAGHRTIVPLTALPGRSIDFDFQQNRIEYYDRRPAQQGRDNVVTRLKYEDLDGLLFVPVRLNGKLGRALIDTGSDVTYVNSVYARSANARLEPEKTRLLFGTANMNVDVKVFSAKRFKIGAHRMSNFDILAADPPVFEHLGVADQPMMVIGLDLLREFRMQIDRQDGVVLLGRAPPSGSKRHFKISPQQGRVRRY